MYQNIKGYKFMCVGGEFLPISSNKEFWGNYVSMMILLRAHWCSGTSNFNILLLHTNVIPKLIGDGF